MAQPYVGEIRLFASNFAPRDWLFCHGQLLPIAENEVLFQLIGTRYGGDGESNFALPDLRGRVPLHFGVGPDTVNYPISQMAGTESETLTTQQIPVHTHPLLASTDQTASVNPGGAVIGAPLTATPFYADTPNTGLAAQSISLAGGSQPHENCQPYLCINYIISLFGLFPSPT
jgi:microcystin-dependent protein